MSAVYLLRKSSSSLLHRRLVVASCVNFFSSPLHQPPPPASFSSLSSSSFSSVTSSNDFSVGGIGNFSNSLTHKIGDAFRAFHSDRVLEASGIAVAAYSEDDKKRGSSEDGLDISKLGISNDIVSSLARRGITKLFPIQRAVLEPAMQGRDMIGRARTGTGKTLAFGIPILDKIMRYNEANGRGKNPLALVLAPTRELARQVDKEFYESAPSLDTLCVYGGSPISRQISTLDNGVDAVVGTPGRVIDLIKRGALSLSEVQFVVLDEADQMLNVGFAEDVEVILAHIRQKHQTMMFSATMPSWIMKITQKFLKNPVHIDLVGDSDQKLADGISLYSISCEMREKPAILGPLVTEHAKGGKCIIFTQTKRDADRLANALQRKFDCEPLHGDISQHQRERTLAGFRDGRFNILVATDVAARGLDVPNVDLVIHYELPNSSEIFVHRSGRTGRAGKKGAAILIYSSSQFRDVKHIERDVGCRFNELPTIKVEGDSMSMLDDMGRGNNRFGSSGGSRFGESGFGRSGFGRSGGFGNSGSGRFGSYGGSQSGRSGGFGGGSSGGGFGQFGSGGSGGYGGSNSGRSGSFGSGGFGGSERRGGFGGSDRRGGFGGSDRSSSFGDFGSNRSSGFGKFGEGSKANLFGDD